MLRTKRDTDLSYAAVVWFAAASLGQRTKNHGAVMRPHFAWGWLSPALLERALFNHFIA